MSSEEEEKLMIDTWSRKYAMGYDSDGFPEGEKKKKKKKKHKKHKKDKKEKKSKDKPTKKE